MEKLLLIMNPCAGQKKGKKLLADIIEIFNRADYAVFTHITTGSGMRRLPASAMPARWTESSAAEATALLMKPYPVY